MTSLFLGLAALLLTIHLLAPRLLRLAYRVPRHGHPATPESHGLSAEAVALATAGGKWLHAWFVPAGTGRPGPAVAILHGWGGNAGLMLPFADLLHRAGYGVLLLDARNHGRSDSDDFSSLPRFAEDLEQGFDWLRARPEVDPAQVALLGHSVGAAAALLVAARRPEVAAVVSLAAFAHPVTLMRRQMRAHHIPYIPLGWWVLRVIQRTIGARYGDIAPVNTIRRVRCPVLLVHGEDDLAVPVADAERIHANRPGEHVRLRRLSATGHDSVERVREHGGELVGFLDGALRRP
ncbi:alpha/beta hydrolase [Thioalbus denitrificans]|uniref:Serine aminopeptidase S33 family n=1 Tax=Thioalbus denitrificans TaxID=547122 RepID=A0A369CIW8_9GAMM|nr:alpha/beta fold hydrolase [Thioalbus denitrificans]RCX31794.1 serine aminopeptidase S33 family [Thioalbus denitrificans]